jgi:phage/plasmid-like protein (TIGR03299 family)
MSKYNVNGLPWASGIGQDVSDCTTAQEVMEKAGLDFYVDKCDLVARMPFNINGNNRFNELGGEFAKDGYIYRDCPKAYSTYRTDTNTPLGLVKDKYEVIQNIEAFNFFNDAIGLNKAHWDRAGKFGYGHKIFVSAKLPNTINVGGDEIDNYLVFSNSHDGSSSINILFSPIRVICTNMLNSALNSSHSYIRIKHTKSARDKIERGTEILRIACEHANNAEQLYNSLLTIKMSDEDVMKYIANLQLTENERLALLDYDNRNGYKKLFRSEYLLMERTNISQRKINQITNMFEYYMDGIGQKHIAGTAWGAYNAVTGFYSNVANLEREKRVDSLLYGGANRNMNKALVAAVDLKVA